MEDLSVRKWAEEFWLNEQRQKEQDGEEKTPSSSQKKVVP